MILHGSGVESRHAGSQSEPPRTDPGPRGRRMKVIRREQHLSKADTAEVAPGLPCKVITKEPS